MRDLGASVYIVRKYTFKSMHLLYHNRFRGLFKYQHFEFTTYAHELSILMHTLFCTTHVLNYPLSFRIY